MLRIAWLLVALLKYRPAHSSRDCRGLRGGEVPINACCVPCTVDASFVRLLFHFYVPCSNTHHSNMSVLLSSPRCPNAFPCKYSVMTPSNPASRNPSKSHIRIVPTPLLQRLEHNRMCRRQAYIAKVKRNGDDRKWEHRCDQVGLFPPLV